MSSRAGDEVAETCDDRGLDRRMTRAHAPDRGGYGRDLFRGDETGDVADLRFAHELAIGTDDARDPLAGEFPRRGTAVRGRDRIVAGVEVAEPEVHIANQRE